MFDYFVIKDCLGRTLGRLRYDGYVLPGEGCTGPQMAQAFAEELVEQHPDRRFLAGEEFRLILGAGHVVAILVDGRIVLPHHPPTTPDTTAFWTRVDVLLAKAWATPPRVLL